MPPIVVRPNKPLVAAATPASNPGGLAFLFSQWYTAAQSRQFEASN
jgi:hypothetical protein